MHVISRLPFNEARAEFPQCGTALADMLRTLEKGSFSSPEAMQKAISSLDNFKYRNTWWVSDVSGNTPRIIAFIDYQLQKVFIKHIASHAGYDKLTQYYREHKE